MNTLNAADFLTPKQRNFCDEYFLDMNATAAALRAGYSASTALNGSLMAMPKIKLYMQQRQAELAAKVNVNHEMVLRELCKIAFGNMGNYFAGDGSIKPMHQLSEDEKAALWSVSVSDAGSGAAGDTVTKFRMYNKLAALDKIAKHINFYNAAENPSEVRYICVSETNLTADDRFDDDELGYELERERLRKERDEIWRKEAEARSIESGVFGGEESPEPGVLSQEADVDDEPHIDDVEVLREGAGIAYEPETAIATTVKENPAPTYVKNKPGKCAYPIEYGKQLRHEEMMQRSGARRLLAR